MSIEWYAIRALSLSGIIGRNTERHKSREVLENRDQRDDACYYICALTVHKQTNKWNSTEARYCLPITIGAQKHALL